LENALIRYNGDIEAYYSELLKKIPAPTEENETRTEQFLLAALRQRVTH